MISVSLIDFTAHGAPAIVTEALALVSSKLCPVIVSRVPPSVLPADGLKLSTSENGYNKLILFPNSKDTYSKAIYL